MMTRYPQARIDLDQTQRRSTGYLPARLLGKTLQFDQRQGVDKSATDALKATQRVISSLSQRL